MRTSKLSAAAPCLMLLAALLSASLVIAGDKKKPSSIDDSKRVLHALNRLSFGPRPGDIDRVNRLGLDKWIEQQLHPEKIDDAQLEARLEPLRTLRMDSRELTEKFPPAPLVRAVAEGRKGMPSDPNERAVYHSAIDRYRTRQERKAQEQNPNGTANAAGDDSGGAMQNVSDQERQKRREARMYAEQRADLLAIPPKQQFAEILKMSPEQRQALLRTLSEEERATLLNGFTPEQREIVQALLRPEAVVVNELQQAKLLRAVYSDRQLQEVMADFWFNHFNVFINKGADRYLVTAYERDVIRPRVFGKFKDLLKATAQSPAMLFYLDNWESVGPKSEVGMGLAGRRRPQTRRGFGRRFPRLPPTQTGDEMRRRPQQNRPRGLNENYAREIMELHTLGVDGGYTQNDVTSLAKVFTGWTVRQPRMGGGFEFNSRMHEPGDKVLLGHNIHSGGEKEGEKAVEILAKHPSTAKFISRKLAMRFVSDDPPAALVDRMTQTFLKTDGDIREVLRTLFKSPEFWAPEAYRAKVKTPLEFVASVVRATNTEVSSAQPLIQALNRMGMPLYGMQPPTGYSMKSEAWVNSSALLNRMNFALALGNGRMTGVNFDPTGLLGEVRPVDGDGALVALETTLLAGEVSAQTHETLKKQLSDPQISNRSLDDPDHAPNLGVLAGLILGSPEFQRR